jgi:hypothetical protein
MSRRYATGGKLTDEHIAIDEIPVVTRRLASKIRTLPRQGA